MSTPRKDSGATGHAMDEAKPPKVEKSSGADNSGKLAAMDEAKPPKVEIKSSGAELTSSRIVVEELIDVAVVKGEQQVKSLEEVATEMITQDPTKESISSQLEVPPAVDSNVDSSEAIATEEVSVSKVPTIEITDVSPDEIKEEPEQTTGASEKVEQKIEIEKNIKKLPQKPVCEKPENPNVPEKVKLKSSEDTTLKEVKLLSETKTQKESELSKFDTNIDLNKTESVPEKTVANVPAPDSSTGKDESKELKSSDTSEKSDRIYIKGQKSEIQAMEVEKQTSAVPKSETCLKTDLGELKSSEEMPEPLVIGISDSEQVLLYKGKVKAGESTQATATKPVCSKASDDFLPSNIDLKGLASERETAKFSKYFDAIQDWSFDSYLHGDRKKTRLRITKPDFPYASTRLQQCVEVNQGKFQVFLDVSQFDFKNIQLSIKDGKINVCAKQSNDTTSGFEHHEIQRIFKIPNHVNADEFTASITNNYRLLVEAPIRIPSSASSK